MFRTDVKLKLLSVLNKGPTIPAALDSGHRSLVAGVIRPAVVFSVPLPHPQTEHIAIRTGIAALKTQ